MKDYEEFEKVWDALEDDPIERADMKARADLFHAIELRLRDLDITQIEISKLIGEHGQPPDGLTDYSDPV